jgi:hypothetical protein
VQESPSWRLQVGTPAPALAGDVFGYSGYDEHVARPIRRLEIGTPCPTLIIGLGSEFRVSPISSRWRRTALYRGIAQSLGNGGDFRTSGRLAGTRSSPESNLAACGWRVRGVSGWIAFVGRALRDVGSYPRRKNPAQVWAAEQTSLGVERSQSPRRRCAGKQIGSKSGLELSPLHREVSRDYWPDSQGTSPSMAISQSADILGPNLAFVG